VGHASAASDVRRTLAAYVREQARARDRVASDVPGDERSARTARRLDELAEYVESLSDDDSRLLALAGVQSQHADEGFVAGDTGAYMVSRFAYDAADARQDCDEFMSKLAGVIVREDRETQMRDLDEQLRSPAVDTLLDEFERGSE